MRVRYWLSTAAGAVALGFFVMPAEAVPLSGVAGDLKAIGENSNVKQASHYRRGCWRHRGHLRCHRRGARYYDPYYYSDPYYYGPSVGFFFGGHGHGFHGHGFHGHGGHGHGGHGGHH